MQLNGDKKSYVSFQLNQLIPSYDDPFVEYITVSMPYAVIPNSTYNITDDNNFLALYIDGTSYLSYTFPNGNYNTTTFISAWTSIVASELVLTFNSTTNKFTITSTAHEFELLASSTIDFVMGFSGDTMSSATAPYTLTMPRCVNFLPPPVFNILTDSIYNGTVLGTTYPKYGNVLASIPNAGKLGVETVYQNALDEYVFNPNTTGTLTFSICNNDGKFIDFNGLSCYFSLRFKIYKKVATKIHGSFSDLAQSSANIRALMEE